jgi:hypothetical protein
MPSLSLRFDNNVRPLVSVEVKPGIPLQPEYLMAPPNKVPSITADFLIDTGADGCWMSEELISSWRLMKAMPILTQSGRDPAAAAGYTYPLSIRLHELRQPESWYHAVWGVHTLPAVRFKDEPFSGVIGMDLLRSAVLHCDGPARTASLSWA